MLIELEARDFRNLESIHWKLEAGSHLLLGENGAGKTSLLEAIYLLATTRSFRTAQLKDCLRHGASDFRLVGEVESERRSRLEINWSGKSLKRSLNGQRGSLAEHLAVQPVICWSIEQAEVLSGGPGQRRRFLDRGVLGLRPAALEVMTRYRQALKAKRQLLVSGVIDGGQELEVWNALLAGLAAEWIQLRAVYVADLQQTLEQLLDECDLGLPPVLLQYRPSPARGLEGAESIGEALHKVVDREKTLKRTLIGPHRDELEIRWSEHAVRKTASAGERKALGLLLLASQGVLLSERNKFPLYLLDDVDTELDQRRLEQLWKVFRRKSQLIVTSNRPAIWGNIELDHRWRCSSGSLQAERLEKP